MVTRGTEATPDGDPPELHRRAAGQPPAVADADFRRVFDCAAEPYLLLAPDAPTFTMLAANEARLRATMTRLEDVIGKPLFDVFPDNPTDAEASGVRNLEASLREVMRTGRPHRMPMQKYDIRTPTGEFEERYWDPLNTPVFDDDGLLIGIIHHVEDVTEQVLTEKRLERETKALAEETRARKEVEAVLEKLRESEERYRLLADMIPQNIWTTDAAGQYTYFSRRWYEFTGATADASHGEGWMSWIHPDDRERMLVRWQQSRETGEPYEIEYRFRSADGDYHWFLGKAMPLRDAAGNIVEWFGTATDISERKQLDEERERLLASEKEARAEADRRREELERVTRSRERLMRGFSHDLKNPLGAADGHAQLLETGYVGEISQQQRDSLVQIRRSIHAALGLIEELLQLARTESDHIEVRLQPADLRETVRDVVEAFRAQCEAKGLALRVELPDDFPAAETDAARVRQVLGNLVSNAIKYTPDGAVEISMGFRDNPATSSRCVAVSVSDTGPGIPEEKQHLLFQEFVRLQPATTAGAGIGLTISRRLARALGGDITFRSAAGHGATFTLWLPPPASQR